VKNRGRVYVTGIDESCRDSILARAIELRNAGTLRVFLAKMGLAERLKIKPAIATYEKSKMGKGNAKGQATWSKSSATASNPIRTLQPTLRIVSSN